MRRSVAAHLVFACAFTSILLLIHASVLTEPYFWDEMGQFMPASLDLFRDGSWIPHSTLPNVHPPGLMAYLTVAWNLFGYSIVKTRAAMFVLAAAGVYFTFLLALEFGKPLRGLPAFTAVLLLLASPLFWSQSMMVQLDMPAMVFTLLAILLFV